MVNDNALEQALAALLEERSVLDQAIAGLERRLGKSTGTASPATAIGKKPVPTSGEIVAHPGEFHQHSLPEAAEKILHRAGRPVKTNEIVSALQRAEFSSKSKTLAQSVYTSLARNPTFEKVRPNTWGLREWYPNAPTAEAEPRRRRKKGRKSGPKSKRAEKSEDQRELQLKTG